MNKIRWIVEDPNNGSGKGIQRCCGHQHRSYRAAIKCWKKNPGMVVTRYINHERDRQTK